LLQLLVLSQVGREYVVDRWKGCLRHDVVAGVDLEHLASLELCHMLLELSQQRIEIDRLLAVGGGSHTNTRPGIA